MVSLRAVGSAADWSVPLRRAASMDDANSLPARRSALTTRRPPARPTLPLDSPPPDFVGPAHGVEYSMALLINEAGEQLLRVTEDDRPTEDLRGRVQGSETGYELAAHEQEAEKSGDGAGRQLERRERDGKAVRL